MKTPLFRFTLYAIIVYLTGGTFNPAIAASQPSGENGTHLCGVVDGQPRFHRDPKQPDNHRYAQSFASNLNIGEPYTVRLIYFLPSDRESQPDIDEKMDKLIKTVQQYYADQMEIHGFGRKTFLFETDATGKAVVHHVVGRFTDSYYRNLSYTWDIWGEIEERFDTSKNFYLTAIDVSSGVLDRGKTGGRGGDRGGTAGQALIPASGSNFTGSNFNYAIAAHELGHAFGLLPHDFRPTSNYFCYYEWLDVHRAFNPSQSAVDQPSTIKMLPPSLASPPNAIRLRFEVTDPDGLHQVQLITTEVSKQISGVVGEVFRTSGGLLGCKRLNREPNRTIEFVTIELIPENKFVFLRMIDVHGNISGSQRYPIDITSLLPSPEVVSIPDLNLAAAVRREIGNITTRSMLNLTHLYVPNRQITNFTGLEHARRLAFIELGTEYVDGEGWVNSNTVSDFSPLEGLTRLRYLSVGSNSLVDVSSLADLTSLRRLVLWQNTISDVSPLTSLTQLIELQLDGNPISDVSPLSSLTQLEFLSLRDGNAISDVSALSGLTRLKRLHLSYNAITDVSPLTSLTQLRELHLASNPISDVSPLSGLTQLTVLDLRNNAILDVSPLVGLDLIGTDFDSIGLYLQHNPLSYASIHTHIPAMQAKGIEVQFDNRTPTTLRKISGAAQQGAVDGTLPLPFVVEVRDEHGAPFEGVPVTFTVTAGGGKLSATTATTDLTGRAQTRLTLGGTAGTNTVSVSAVEISEPVRFTATAVLLSSPVTVPDAALRAKITEVLGKPPGGSLTMADMLTLTALTANNANIRELTRLQHASNLTTLSLNNNSLSDVSSLAGLPKLKMLSLDNNSLSDVAPLTALLQLKTLSLDNNNLSDVAPLTALLQLKTLSLDNNNLSDVAPLGGLTQLTTLSLGNNNLSDVSTLVKLPQLKTLHLRGNPLSYPSLHTYIPTLQAAGVEVAVDLRTPTTLLKISGAHGVAGAAFLFVVEVRDQDNRAFSGVPVVFAVTAGGGHLFPPTAVTDVAGRARTTLTLGGTPGENTVRASVAEVVQPVGFTITAIDANSPGTVPDAALRAQIAATLDKPGGAQLTAGDMLTLTNLNAPNANIQDLTGLEYARTLRELNLGGEWVSGEGYVNSNAVSNFSSLEGLTQLTYLSLGGTSLSDISTLAGLTQLNTLPALQQLHLGCVCAGGINTTDIPVSSQQLSFGYICAGRIDTTEYAESWGQLSFGYICAGGVDTTERAVSWEQLAIGYICAGGVDTTDIPVSSQQRNLGCFTSGGVDTTEYAESFLQRNLGCVPPVGVKPDRDIVGQHRVVS